MSDQLRGPSISFENVSVAYGQNVVLENIDFSGDSGAIHAIIGPNGGGKSTFIKALLGEMRHSGTISLTWPTTPGIIGYVPQMIEIDKTLPVSINDFMALCVQKRPAFLGLDKSIKTKVEDTLARLGLTGKEKLLYSELSGGERQRLLFAQALIPSPDLLILDEPMNSLDKVGAEIFAQVIQELKAEGVTIILIHHDLKQVEEISDSVTCINGEILFSGPPTEVMDKEHLLEIFSAKATDLSDKERN